MLDHPTVAEAMQRVMANEHLPLAAFQKLQTERLRELVRFAAENSAFYAGHFDSLDLQNVELTDLPPVNKPIIQANFDEVVTDSRIKLADVKRFCQETGPDDTPWFLDEYCALVTSGTTGNRGNYLWDKGALAEAIAVGFRQSNRGPASTDGGAIPQRIAAIVQIDVYDATNILLSMIPPEVGTKRIIDIRQDFAEICAGLQEFQPTLLASYPYMLWLLAEAQTAPNNPLNIRPQRITSSADVLNQSDRTAIRAAFGVDPHNYYCSTEFPYLCWECDAHEGLHVNADSLILESVDAQNQPVPPGQLGDKVLVTSLSNRVLPLIRYEMSDQVENMTEPCSCGCVLPRIRTVAGREEHILTLPGTDGTPVRLIEEYVDDIVGPKTEVATYQVIQEAPDRFTINAVGRAGYTWEQVRDAITDGLAECFAKYGVASELVELNVREVEQLEPITPGSEKVCRFWNRSD
ncbi:MAG: phenylacetate--CoA ligase family protein [Planctomycetaceae bacterium]